MEKWRPSFDLEAFRSVCGDPQRLAITSTALRSAEALGFKRIEVADVVRAISPNHFFKSMSSYADHRLWQDVYHVPWDGMTLYVKFTNDVVTEFVVLSFKER